MPASPGMGFTSAPGWKSEPSTWTSRVVPRAATAGDADVGFGAGSTTKQAGHVPEEASPFVTVTSRLPVAAASSIEICAPSLVALLNVVLSTSIPVPENDGVAPDVKPLPRITIDRVPF